jgi:hypothetical protein
VINEVFSMKAAIYMAQKMFVAVNLTRWRVIFNEAKKATMAF